ncbi:MAG: hypothetical protein EBX40_08875, partial [Gammaproteobacteria bacterium]|nr:hypothetical protein [Gammaproteobacteria bacterium]
MNGAHALTVNAGTGTITLGGTIGGSAPTGALSFTGSAINVQHNITTQSANVSFTGPVTTSANALTINVGTSSVLSFSSTLNVNTNTTLIADQLVFNGGTGSVSGSSTLTLLPGTGSQTLTLSSSSGSFKIQTDPLYHYAGDLWIGARSTDSTPTAGAITVSNALNVSGNLYLIATGDISLGSIAAANATLVSTAGNILNSTASTTNITAGAVVLGAQTQLGTSTNALNITATSVQAWQGNPVMYLSVGAVSIDNTPGVVVLQFIPGATGSSKNRGGGTNASYLSAFSRAVSESLSIGNPSSSDTLLSKKLLLLSDDA